MVKLNNGTIAPIIASKRHRLNSIAGEIQRENYIKINNANLCAEEVAIIIKEKFQL